MLCVAPVSAGVFEQCAYPRVCAVCCKSKLLQKQVQDTNKLARQRQPLIGPGHLQAYFEYLVRLINFLYLLRVRLQVKVQDTNALARQRVEANRLLDLVSAGKRDIEAGQQRIDKLLNRILGRQDQANQVSRRTFQKYEARNVQH